MRYSTRPMYKRESIEALRQLIDPKDIISSVGGVSIRDISDNGDEIRCPCPLHGGDNKTGFTWKRSRGSWKCFTHDCGSECSHDLFGFVSFKLGISFIQAVEYVAQTINFSLEKGDSSGQEFTASNTLIKDFNSRSKYKIDNLEKLQALPQYHPQGFDYMITYLESRGYSYSAVKSLNFYPLLDSFKFLRMGIPIYDDKGNLVGVNARLMDTILTYPKEVNGKDGRVYPVPKYRMSSFQKGSVLYNLQLAKDISYKDGIILVEGQLDVARLNTYGFTNAVCTLGTSLTAQQAALLYRHCFGVTFLVEEGEPALKGVMRSIKHLKVGMQVAIAKLPSGDADSNTKETVLNTLNNKQILNPEDIESICLGVKQI